MMRTFRVIAPLRFDGVKYGPRSDNELISISNEDFARLGKAAQACLAFITEDQARKHSLTRAQKVEVSLLTMLKARQAELEAVDANIEAQLQGLNIDKARLELDIGHIKEMLGEAERQIQTLEAPPKPPPEAPPKPAPAPKKKPPAKRKTTRKPAARKPAASKKKPAPRKPPTPQAPTSTG